MDADNQQILDALLDAWERHNRALLNLLRALPAGSLAARALPGSPSIGEMCAHIHHERMVSVFENAPGVRGRGAEDRVGP